MRICKEGRLWICEERWLRICKILGGKSVLHQWVVWGGIMRPSPRAESVSYYR
jgi:hypothetical protein